MGILREFEERLEGVVEGLFARVFRSGVQPVELGKRLVRAVEDGRTVGVRRVYVPNVFTYELSAADRERFADYEHALGAELAQLAVQTARDHDWAMLGPARVAFETNDELPVGRFRVEARVEPDGSVEAPDAGAPAAGPGHGEGWSGSGIDPDVPVGPATAVLPGEQRARRPRAAGSLVLVAGRRAEQTFPLTSIETTIGRAETCDITLADPGVSRTHARVLREGDDYVVEDLRSTNGTEVNHHPVVRRRLADGDVVKVGNTTLHFRRER
jgi:hypothetical protein